MNGDNKPRLEITDRHGNRIVEAREHSAEDTIATINGRLLAAANRGTSLNLDWVETFASTQARWNAVPLRSSLAAQ